MTEQEKDQLRNFLIGELREGRIELDVARAKAAEARIDLERPDPTKFDPKMEAYWTIPMAVAWIQFRDIDNVRDQYPRWRREHAFFRQEIVQDAETGQVLTRWGLIRLDGGGIANLVTNEELNQNTSERQLLMTTEDARKALWLCLGGGEIVATGKKGMASRRPIEAHIWQDLHVGWDAQGNESLFSSNDNYGWREVTVPAYDVLKLWPQNETDTIATEKTRKAPTPVRTRAPKQEIERKFEPYLKSVTGKLTTRQDTRLWFKQTFGSRAKQLVADEYDERIAAAQNRKPGPSKK